MQKIVIGKDIVSVAKLLGKGGEGEVYSIDGHSGLAVKIYSSSSLRAKREEKVRAMVAEGLAAQTDLIAYPGEVVTDLHGNFLGFVMLRVSGYRPLHELYSPKSRQRHFPKSDYRFIVHAALNVARAVGKVHQTGCVIGDLNHSGVLVAQDATVSLIDADSFQFSLNGKSYPCVVGVPDFTPPELHGKNLAAVQRTIQHDNFGLAVAIFQLLFMNRHPYAGRFNGPDLSIGQAIAQNRFAYSLIRRAETRTTPPPGALTLDMFPNEFANLFEDAFGLSPNLRPGALDWVRGLKNLEGSLNRCGKVKTHFFPSVAGGCVWCKLTADSSYDMFPDSSSGDDSVRIDTRGTEAAIREILSFQFPTASDLLPRVPAPSGVSNTLRDERNRKQGRALLGLLMLGGAAAGFFYLIEAWIMWVGLTIWGWVNFSDREISSGPYLQAFKRADEGVQRELNAFVQRNGMAEVVKVRIDLDSTISAYKAHDGTLSRDLQSLKANREARQRRVYLDRFNIRSAKISGIGPAKKATLISFGIETAADISKSTVMRVPGFGSVMATKLVSWRAGIESRFRYDPNPNAQDVSDEKELRRRYTAEKAKLESSIRNGLNTLKNAKIQLTSLPGKARVDKALINALAVRSQTERDLRELGVVVPSSGVALMVAPEPKPTPTPSLAPRFTTHKTSAPLITARARPTQNTNLASNVPDCPFCGRPMVKRTARRGRNAGGKFWGCSGYPYCKGTRNI